jgi:hypothetical protein
MGSAGKYWTFQDMLCSTGGGQSKTAYHLWFVGTAVTLAQTTDFELGRPKWGKGETKCNVNISLGFSIAHGPASVTASAGNICLGGGTIGGDIGSDGRFGHYPSAWQNYQRNRVNAFWVSPHNWPWDGSTSYEGNDSEVLYEWPMGMTGNLGLKSYSVGFTFYVQP